MQRIRTIFRDMIKPESWKVWLIFLILVGTLGFLADSVDQFTTSPRGLTSADDDRDDGAGEAESVPAQEATARSAPETLQRRRPGAALAVPTRVARIAAPTHIPRRSPSHWMLASTPSSQLELRI